VNSEVSAPVSHGFVVMSRDRPEMLRQAVNMFKFIVNSDHPLIISDNSSSAANSNEAKKISSEYNCIFWENDNLSVMTHYHSILSRREEYEYLTILHDDDIIMPGFLSAVEAQLGNEGNFSVIGYNALFCSAVPGSHRFGDIKCSGRRTLNADSDVLISDPLQLLLRWVSPFCAGIAPLSGCTFNLKCYERWFFDVYSSSGLYFDTLLMMLFSEAAPIKWVSDSVGILLREHDSRLSAIASERDDLSFVNSAKSYFASYWRIRILLQFFLCSRQRSRAEGSASKKLLTYSSYYLLLCFSFILWPRKVPSLLIRRLKDH
jgi:hypothetical protein